MLDEKINKEVNNFRKRNEEWYKTIFSLNELCDELGKDISMTKFNKNPIEIYIITNFLQIKTSFEAFVTLTERCYYLINQMVVAKDNTNYTKIILQKYYYEIELTKKYWKNLDIVI